MRKRDELTDPSSCLNRAADDEWLFVFLGRDIAAPVAVRAWIEERIRLGKNTREDAQIGEAEQWIRDVWEDKNDRRLELAEKKSRGELTGAEAAEFEPLQIAYFDYLNTEFPRNPPLDLAKIEQEAEARANGKKKETS